MLGLAFLNSTWYLLAQSDLAVGTQPEAGATFAVVGAHVAMTIAGLLMLAVMAFRTFAGQFSSRYPDGWSATAVYWHTMVGVFVLVWYCLLYTSRSPRPPIASTTPTGRDPRTSRWAG